MKSRLAFFASAILTITYAHAADLTWNDGDSTGNWNTSDANWTGSIWDSSTPDNAIFGATAIGTVTLTESITVGNITFNNAGYTIASDTLNLSGSTIHTAADATISSVLDGTTGMMKSGAGMLSLTGVGTYSGGTTINGGTLSLESTTSDVAVNGTVTVNGGGILRIAGPDWAGFGSNSGRKIDLLNVVGGTVNNTLYTSFITDATINMTAGTISGGEINWRNSALNSLASESPATVSSKFLIRNDYNPGVALVFDVADGDAAIDLLVSGNMKEAASGASVTKNGTGALSLSNWNSYTGGTTVNGGSLTLDYSGGVAIRGTVTVNSEGTLIISGSDWVGFGETSGAKIDTLNVVGGTVNNTLNTSFITDATVNLTGGTISGGEIHWRNSALNSLADANTATIFSNVMIRNDYSPGVALVLDVADGEATTDLLVSGNIKQAASGASVTKNGPGTLTLSNWNNYSGATNLNVGVLLVNGSTGSGPVSVASGAVLGGYGSLGGAVDVLSGGKITGGEIDAIGTLATGPLTISGTYRCDVSGEDADKLTVGGALNLTGATLTVIGTPSAVSYTIATYTGTTPSFATVSLPAGYAVSYETAGEINLVQSAGYGSWATTNSVLEGENGDDDKDGISNLVEYALDLDPQAGDPAPGTFTGNILSFTKGADAAAANDVSYIIETSGNLTGWTQQSYVLSGNTITYNLPASPPDGRIFARLKVTKP
jgi:autotransporter-associated beta strand protein